ncbi:hypothetical protein BDR03DRAFT_1011796 [Suillus americanus]|nr:hypothetical protein BDR03DRAFT_1011796 [Suillus americanus]
MDEETIKQAVSAKQATREKSRLHLLMTAWEIEEAERHHTLLSLLQRKNAREYVEASNEAHMFERFMTHHHANQLKDDFDFGVGTYDEELLEFSISEEQLNQLEAFAIDHNLHDSNQTITKDKYSTDPFINSAESEDDDESCCDDVSECRSKFSCVALALQIFQLSLTMPPKKPSKGKRKSKQIPKFPESTGKNPCGNTASAQIGLAVERPAAQCTIDGGSIDGTFVERRPPQMDLPSRDFMVGPLTIPHAPFLPQMAWQIPPSNQQSMAGTSAIPPAQFEQRMPSQSATPFQYQSCLQAPALNVEGIHQAADNYRPGLRMRADHSDALLRVPSVIPGSSRAVRKPVHLCLPPVEPAGTGHIAQPGLGSPAITDQPLMSNSTHPPPLSSATISRIVDSARNMFKRDFLNNLMVASNNLKDMVLRAFNQGVEMHSSPSTMNSVDAWHLNERNKELVHQQVYIDSLCIGFAYLDDPDTNAAFRNPALFRIINRVLLEKRLSHWIDPNKRDHDNIIAFSGTILLWALQEHAKGTAGKSEFVVEDNRAAFDLIIQRLNDLLLSERAAVNKLVDDILAEIQ